MRPDGRRKVIALILTFLVWIMTACSGGTMPVPSRSAESRLVVYVGTYTGSGSRGIYRVGFDAVSGAWSEPALAAQTENPSFLALHPRGHVLYAVNEVANFGGSATGAVSAFSIDASTGALSLLNQTASGGADPCHIIVDSAGKNVLVANYSAGTVAVLPLDADGRLLDASTIRHHVGSGPDAARQKAAHAHEIVLDRDERFALAADLGADRIFVFRFDAATGALTPDDPDSAKLEAGSGPRHLAWHPSGAFVYVISELRSTVTAFRFDAARGVLESFQTITTLPAGFTGKNTAAEIVVSPDGRFLYASNRGDDSIAAFSIDPKNGTLTPLEHFKSGGRAPRHFTIDPSGRWLLVANQNSDSIVAFPVDAKSGRLLPQGQALTISKPVCLVFGTPSAAAR